MTQRDFTPYIMAAAYLQRVAYPAAATKDRAAPFGQSQVPDLSGHMGCRTELSVPNGRSLNGPFRTGHCRPAWRVVGVDCGQLRGGVDGQLTGPEMGQDLGQQEASVSGRRPGRSIVRSVCGGSVGPLSLFHLDQVASSRATMARTTAVIRVVLQRSFRRSLQDLRMAMARSPRLRILV